MTGRSKMNVLIVDDSSTMRRIIKKALAFGGLEPDQLHEAKNGQEGLEVYEAARPGLVISDVNMPVMGGVEMLANLRERGHLERSPVVMVTSTVGAKQALELVRQGASKVIRKPFDPHGLSRDLEPFLNAAESAPEEPAGTSDTDTPSEAPAADAAPEDARIAEVTRALVGGMTKCLELMAFADVQEVQESPPGNRIMLFSSLEFHEPPIAQLHIYCTSDVGNDLAESILGEDPSDDDMARLDAVGELLNVLAGEVMDILEREDGGVHTASFDVPRSGVMSPGSLPSDMHQVALALDDGEGRLYMLFTLQDEGAAATAMEGAA